MPMCRRRNLGKCQIANALVESRAEFRVAVKRFVGQITWRVYSRVTGKPEVSLACRFQGNALIELAE
jgi:hypothetical protein